MVMHSIFLELLLEYRLSICVGDVTWMKIAHARIRLLSDVQEEDALDEMIAEEDSAVHQNL
ncbi:hypothetical protein NC653_009092 [Populus alba x Populus x berolinensis]|uniref:Uncharacterized protein n=1 Tax=Populus alba x Populus x berolinensis TaxID=444605 RepID=A0AAD6R8G7_9ROSI|nr:hypothetical protein NC653_009092 [Populus alba x Populus x berolinensis]